ncbi:MAG: hypothetical protein AAFO91_08760 [Bacteroidota bacterium]
MQEGEVLSQAKRLPRKADGVTLEETFHANGNTYRWLDKSQIGIEAWTSIGNMMEVFYSGQDNASAIHNYHRETAVQSGEYTDIKELKYYISTRTQNFLDGIVERSEARFHQAFHICACMIIKEGDDIRGYSFERAESYIADWAAEGYSWIDFFTVAGSLSEQFSNDYQKTRDRLEAKAKISGKAATDTNRLGMESKE